MVIYEILVFTFTNRQLPLFLVMMTPLWQAQLKKTLLGWASMKIPLVFYFSLNIALLRCKLCLCLFFFLVKILFLRQFS